MLNGIGFTPYSGFGAYNGYGSMHPATAAGSISGSEPVQLPATPHTALSEYPTVKMPVASEYPTVKMPVASEYPTVKSPVTPHTSSSEYPKVQLPHPQGHEVSPYAVTNEQEAREAGMSEGQIRGLKKAGQIECATCASRMYQDGSDENVSFKSAAHVSPTAAGAAVRSHEGEHVSNAYKKAAMHNGKVMSATVSIHMAICPECGRSYVSGGTTSTSIKYYGDKSPAAAHQKSFDEAAGIKGRVIDMGV